MTDNVYSVSEIVGTSPDGVDQAIRNAITRASRTLRNLDWFEVAEVRGFLAEGEIDHFQVRLKVGFRLEEESRPERSLSRCTTRLPGRRAPHGCGSPRRWRGPDPRPTPIPGARRRRRPSRRAARGHASSRRAGGAAGWRCRS